MSDTSSRWSQIRPAAVEIVPVGEVAAINARYEELIRRLERDLAAALAEAEAAEARLRGYPGADVIDDAFEQFVLSVTEAQVVGLGRDDNEKPTYVASTPEAEPPVAQAPVVEAPVVEAPVAEPLIVEAPVAEQPVAEQPVAEPVAPPIVEQPVAEPPFMPAPTTISPDAVEPVVPPAKRTTVVTRPPTASDPIKDLLASLADQPVTNGARTDSGPVNPHEQWAVAPVADLAGGARSTGTTTVVTRPAPAPPEVAVAVAVADPTPVAVVEQPHPVPELDLTGQQKVAPGEDFWDVDHRNAPKRLATLPATLLLQAGAVIIIVAVILLKLG